MPSTKYSKMVLTTPVNNLVAESEPFAKHVWASLLKFNRADWGDTDPCDHMYNDQDLESRSGRILALYKDPTDEDFNIFIIGEFGVPVDGKDHDIITVEFPSDY